MANLFSTEQRFCGKSYHMMHFRARGWRILYQNLKSLNLNKIAESKVQ